MMKNEIVFLILWACIFPEITLLAAKRCTFTGGFTVHVINKLPHSLKLHCQSKDDDLGYHMLDTNDDYKWSFCNNYFGRTVFSCHLCWGDQLVGFDAFTSKWKDSYCIDGQCTWEVRTDGIYLDRVFGFSKMFDWNNL